MRAGVYTYKRERIERNNNRKNEAERDARELTSNAVFYSVSRRIKHTDVLKRTSYEKTAVSYIDFHVFSPILFPLWSMPFSITFKVQIFELEMCIAFRRKHDFSGPPEATVKKVNFLRSEKQARQK